MAISNEIVNEYRRALADDQTRLGVVYRGLEAGLTRHQIAEEAEVQSTGFVWNMNRVIKVLLGGDLPSAPTVARFTASVVNGFHDRFFESLTEGARIELKRIATECIRISQNYELIDEEGQDLDQKSREAENAGVAGMYVYTLPHYYNHPMQPSDEDPRHDRTLMKVGKSDSDVIRRFLEQRRTTALPEEPRLLRIYTGVEGKGDVEGRIHRLLTAADHRRSRGRIAGTEWFLTSLTFLDAVATDMGLTIHFEIDAQTES